MEQRNIKIKMDSACSRNMSGVGGRITDIQIADNTIKGFNGEESKANLVLLCANNYAEDGAVVLLPNYGLHLLAGFTITAMIKQLEAKSIAGVHPDVTIAALKS